MNLHAKLPFDPFNVMKTVFPAFNMHTKENDPYHPYTFTQEWLQGYQAIQQHFWQGCWDWLTWQQWSWQQALYENSRWVTHCLQLTQQPQTLYRYTRMNWQKPYLGLNAQALTSTRLLTQLWIDTFNAWQQCFTEHTAREHTKSEPIKPKQELVKQEPAIKHASTIKQTHHKRRH